MEVIGKMVGMPTTGNLITDKSFGCREGKNIG
jgi:hypothetical protein